jgi:polyisoprenoid-binding protein YceI
VHPIRWLIRGIIVVVLAAVGFGAWYVFGSRAPSKPKLSTTAPVDTGGPATPAGTWKVVRGDNVYVGYRITEVFAGDVIHKTAVGRTPAVDGTLEIVGNELTATDITADMQQLASDRGTRDNYIHTHAIESDKFPHSEFKLTKPLALPTPLRKGALEKLTATGSLTLHGVTRTNAVPLEARWDGSTIEIDASDIPIVLADYKISAPDTGVTKVDGHGSFELSLRFAPA